MERLVWMLQRFDPDTDFLVSALRIDALLSRQIARLVGVGRRVDEVQNHPLTTADAEQIGRLLGITLAAADLRISYVVRAAEWKGVVSETWWIRPDGADALHPDSVFLDDALHDRIRFLVASEGDARFDSWPLDSTGMAGLSLLVGQELDADVTDYYVTCLRTDFATPGQGTKSIALPVSPRAEVAHA